MLAVPSNDPFTIAVRAHQRPIRHKKPHGEWAFIFDTETTTDAAMRLRIGCFRILRRGNLEQEGLFYEHVTPAELALLRGYAARAELPLLPIEDFRDWFFHHAYRLKAT